MAANRFGVILLLVFGVFLMGCNLREANAKFCPYYCRRDTAYMTCPSSGAKHLAPACNCCLAGKGCTIYLGDGTAVCTGT